MSELGETLPSSVETSTSVPMIFRTKTAVEAESRRLGVGHLNINIMINKAHSKFTSTIHLWWSSGS